MSLRIRLLVTDIGGRHLKVSNTKPYGHKQQLQILDKISDINKYDEIIVLYLQSVPEAIEAI